MRGHLLQLWNRVRQGDLGRTKAVFIVTVPVIDDLMDEVDGVGRDVFKFLTQKCALGFDFVGEPGPAGTGDGRLFAAKPLPHRFPRFRINFPVSFFAHGKKNPPPWLARVSSGKEFKGAKK